MPEHAQRVQRRRFALGRPIEPLTPNKMHVNPGGAAAYNNRGVAYAQKGDPDNAIADFSEAVRLNPADGTVYFNRGIAYCGEGDLDRAIADFGQAIQRDPENLDCYRNLGTALLLQGNSQQPD